MESAAAQPSSNNRLVKLSSVVEQELNKLDKNLTETKDKLKSKEEENLELCEEVARLQHKLSSSEECQKVLTEENNLLKLKLRKVAVSLDFSESNDFAIKCEESKAEYQILSNQLDLLEDDVNDLGCEKQRLEEEVGSLQKSLNELTLDNENKQYQIEKANKEINELKQVVSLLEFVVEEKCTQNLTLQSKIIENQNQKRRKPESTKQNKSKSDSSKAIRMIPQNLDHSEHSQLNGDTTKVTQDDLNTNANDDMVLNKPHCAVYLGLFMKSGRFPCKCGSDFGTKHDLKNHILNKNRSTVPCNDCGRPFANRDEMKRHMESFHKQVNSSIKFHKYC